MYVYVCVYIYIYIYIYIRTPDRHGKKISNRVCIYSFSAWKPHLASQVFDLKKRHHLAWVAAVRRKAITFNNIPRLMFVCSQHFHRHVSCKHEVVVVPITLEANTVRLWSLWSGVFLFFFVSMCFHVYCLTPARPVTPFPCVSIYSPSAFCPVLVCHQMCPLVCPASTFPLVAILFVLLFNKAILHSACEQLAK